MESERAYIAILDRDERTPAALPIDEAGDLMAAAMRERFPMLDPFKSFDLARVAIAALMPTTETSGDA